MEKQYTEKNVQLNFDTVTVVDWLNPKCLEKATVPNFDSEQTSFWWLRMMYIVYQKVLLSEPLAYLGLTMGGKSKECLGQWLDTPEPPELVAASKTLWLHFYSLIFLK